jgi:hypothetical protein
LWRDRNPNLEAARVLFDPVIHTGVDPMIHIGAPMSVAAVIHIVMAAA